LRLLTFCLIKETNRTIYRQGGAPSSMTQPTERQLQIAELRRRGDTQEVIAEKLGIARSTVARDWSAIKQEMSYLPLDWSSPSIILPAVEISSEDSAAVFVNLDSLTFERLRKSTALYGSDPDGRGEIFEFREMSIVHALDMKQIPVKYYPEIIHLILKHDCDVISQFDLIKSIIDRISRQVSYSEFPRIEWDEEERGRDSPAYKRSLSGWNGSKGAGLEGLDISDEKLQFILDEINDQWDLENQRLCDDLLVIIGPHLNFSKRWGNPANELDYENEERGDYSLLLDAFDQTIKEPELLELWQENTRFRDVVKLNKSAFWRTRFRNQILMHLGIIEEDIPLAYAHKIGCPALLESFMQSGAEDMNEYNALKQQGFKTVEDKEDYQLIKDDLELLLTQGWFDLTHNPGGGSVRKNSPAPVVKAENNDYIIASAIAQMSDKGPSHYGFNTTKELAGSKVLKNLRLEGWNEDTLKSCIRVRNQFGINIPYAGGHAIAEQWLQFEMPESQVEITMIKKLIEKAPHNYASWVFMDYNPGLITYALQSEERLGYPHAFVTYSTLYTKGFSFADARSEYGGLWLAKFIVVHGLAWIESKYSPKQFAIMAILESSHQQQIAEVKLLETLNTQFHGMFSDNAAIKHEISINLADLCVIHTNGIVEYIANKGAIDFTKTDAISRHQERLENLANIQIIPKKQESVDSVLKRLALDDKAIPRIVARIVNKDTHAMRIARAIQSGDLEEATTVCWRFFVHEVHHKLNHLDVDKPTSEFVHLIDQVQEIVTLSKTEVNTLHNVRMIRNYVEHPDDGLSVTKQRPTWKKIATVLSICEKLQ